MPRPVEPGPYRGCRDSQQRGNLLGGVPLGVVQVHRRPQLFRQPGHRVPQLDTPRITRLSRIWDVLQRQHRTPQTEAVQVRAAVQGGPDQPRLGMLPVPVCRLLKQPQEYILIHVLRVGGILHPAQGQTVHRVAVEPHGIAKGLLRHAMSPFLVLKSAFHLEHACWGRNVPSFEKNPAGDPQCH